MSDDLVKQVKTLDSMDLAGLKAKYTEVFGEEPVGRNKKVLADQIRRRLFKQDIERKRAEREKSAGTESVTERIAALTKMSLAELRAEYEVVLGKKSRSRSRTQLTKRIAETLQSAAYQEKMAGDAKPTLTVTAKFDRKKKSRSKRVAKPAGKKGESTRAQHREPGQRDPRLPKAGTTIERVYKGKKHLVTCLAEGFEYKGKPFKSLSALAMHITGAKAINGFLWLRLGKYAKQEKTAK